MANTYFIQNLLNQNSNVGILEVKEYITLNSC